MHSIPVTAVAAHVDFTTSFDASLSLNGHHWHVKPMVLKEVDQLLWVTRTTTTGHYLGQEFACFKGRLEPIDFDLFAAAIDLAFLANTCSSQLQKSYVYTKVFEAPPPPCYLSDTADSHISPIVFS